MSVSSNNTQLEAILAAVNALPDAGGSAAPETCTVTISKPKQSKSKAIKLHAYSRFLNGERIDWCISTKAAGGIMLIDETSLGSVEISNVIVGSIMELSIAYSTIAEGAIDANCMVASYECPSEVVDPNSITEENWVAGPITLSSAYVGGNTSSNRVTRFKILGDTTIIMYDND